MLLHHRKDEACKTCTNAEATLVPFSLRKGSEILVVGESPGQQEILQGEGFIGRSGELNARLFHSCGLVWSDCSRANSAQCMIRKDDLSAREITNILKCCRPRLEEAVRALKPKCIVAMGGAALEQVLKRKKITQLRGTWFWSEEFQCWVMPTFHPAHALRNPAVEPKIVEDLRKVMDLKVRDWQMPEASEDVSWREVQSIRRLLDKDTPTLISLDSETTSLDWHITPPIMLCYSLSFKKGQAWVVRLFEEEPDLTKAEFQVNVKRVPEGKKKALDTTIGIRKCENFETKLDELLELCKARHIRKVLQNGNFDIHWFKSLFSYFRPKESFAFRGYWMDTQAAAHVFDESLYTQSRLEELQTSFTDLQDDYWRRFGEQVSKTDMPAAPLESLIFYSAGDADCTRRVAVTLESKLREDLEGKAGDTGTRGVWNYYRKLVHPALQVLWEMETNGIRVDMDALPDVKMEIHREAQLHHEHAIKAIPEAILKKHEKKGLKLSRRDLLKDALFSDEGFNIPSDLVIQTKSGPSFNKESRIALLSKRGVPKQAKTMIEHYDSWDRSNALLTRDLKKFQDHVKADGRIHTGYSLVMARTGRSSSKSPNLQNISKRSSDAAKVRRLLVADPNEVLLMVDYSQSELRWLAQIAQEPTMIKVFQDGLDLHMTTGELLTGKKASEMTPEEKKSARQKAKSANFGLIYLISPMGYVRHAKTGYGVTISENTAREWMDLFFSKYSKIRDYHRRTIDFCREHGYVESPLGRRRHLQDINSPDGYINHNGSVYTGVKGEACRQAVNHPVQSASSDVSLLTMVELRRTKVLDRRVKLRGFIHDELIFSLPRDKKLLRDTAQTVYEVMINPPLERDFGIKMLVPLEADMSIGTNLADTRRYPVK